MKIIYDHSETNHLAEITANGIHTSAILPTTHGFYHMAECAALINVDVIIVPSSYGDPGLLDRLRGYSLRVLLENTDKQVIITEPDGTMRHANP